MSRSSYGLDLLDDATDWRLRAKCRDEDPVLFFPQDDPNGARRAYEHRYASARRICRHCDVAEQCLRVVLGMTDTVDQYGMYGGYTPAERRQLRACRDGNCEHGSHRRRR